VWAFYDNQGRAGSTKKDKFVKGNHLDNIQNPLKDQRMNTKILVVEDEPAIGEYIHYLLTRMGYQVPAVADSYHGALEKIKETDPDLLLIDISLGGDRDGVDLAMEIRKSLDRPFIFVTSYTDLETIERVKHVKPDGYLTKPFKDQDIHIAIEMALNNFSHAPQSTADRSEIFLKDCIFIRSHKNFLKMPFPEIEWLKADKNYTEIHTKKQKHIVRNTLNEVEARLPQDQFVRVHRSYIVRLEAIKALDSQNIHLESTVIPISRKIHGWLLDKLNLLSS
jgi:DNA-binding LytR/AlgR family response regulator